MYLAISILTVLFFFKQFGCRKGGFLILYGDENSDSSTIATAG
jgi:hypothetical protein